MAPRLDLHNILVGILGSSAVYFQPPANVNMAYPCIVYNLEGMETKFADDKPYSVKRRYQVTVIDADPDSDILAKVAALPMCSYERFFTADNLNHDVYNLYF